MYSLIKVLFKDSVKKRGREPMGGFMRVRVLAFCLCCFLVMNSIPVYAAVDNDTLSLAQYHFVKLGFIVKDWDWFLDNADFQTYCLNLNNGTYFYKDDEGNYVFTDEASDVAKGIIDAYISDQQGGDIAVNDFGDYYMVPTYSYDELWEWVDSRTENNGDNWGVAQRNNLKQILNENDFALVSHYGSGGLSGSYLRVCSFDISYSEFLYTGAWKTGSTVVRYNFKPYDSNGVEVPVVVDGSEIYYMRSTNESISVENVSCSDIISKHLSGNFIDSGKTYFYAFTKAGQDLRVWKNMNALSKYLTDGMVQKYYTLSSYASFDVSQDNSFSIDQQTYNNIKGNFNTVNQQFSQVIDDINIQNNSTITYNQLQQIIDNSVTNIVNNYYYIIVDPEEPGTGETGPSDGEQEIINTISGQMQQEKEFRDEDRQDATSAGEAMNGLASDLETGIKSQWEILWFPIEFTQSVFSAFQGSGASTYNVKYGNITGYRYDNETATLQPVYDLTRTAKANMGGTVINFPEYTLPVLNVKIWDGASFDLATIKASFPELFNAIYVVISILEVYWFVGFLHDKFMEVFGT